MEASPSDPGSNVVGLRGEPVPEAGTPDPHLIAKLEDLLEMARSGELQGFAGAGLYRDGTTLAFSSGTATRSLLGTLYMILAGVRDDLVDGNG